jgi:hypothetical protein
MIFNHARRRWYTCCTLAAWNTGVTGESAVNAEIVFAGEVNGGTLLS